MSEATLNYDVGTRTAVIEFPNGHRLKVSNVDEAKANQFFAKHAKEFERRDCVLHTSACFEVRSNG
jgi:hypothetical protein